MPGDCPPPAPPLRFQRTWTCATRLPLLASGLQAWLALPPPARRGTGGGARGASGVRRRAPTARRPAQAPATATHAATSWSRDLAWQSHSYGTSGPPRKVAELTLRPRTHAAQAGRCFESLSRLRRPSGAIKSRNFCCQATGAAPPPRGLSAPNSCVLGRYRASRRAALASSGSPRATTSNVDEVALRTLSLAVDEERLQRAEQPLVAARDCLQLHQ